MLAHREARALAFANDGKLRVLEELLIQHQSERILIFTDNNATVYNISKRFLLPAITHQTKVKERHEILSAFRAGDYPRLVTSRVLNEGIDVPEASVAIVLSGTSTTREYVQRLGRILRKQEGKLALLFEVIAKDTSEERVSERRQTAPKRSKVAAPESPTTPKPLAETSSPLDAINVQEGLDFEDL